MATSGGTIRTCGKKASRGKCHPGRSGGGVARADLATSRGHPTLPLPALHRPPHVASTPYTPRHVAFTAPPARRPPPPPTSHVTWPIPPPYATSRGLLPAPRHVTWPKPPPAPRHVAYPPLCPPPPPLSHTPRHVASSPPPLPSHMPPHVATTPPPLAARSTPYAT